MKKRIATILSALLALVLSFSFVGCKRDNSNGMTQEKWEAAFAKSGTLTNRTEKMGYTISIDLKQNGKSITKETDLGNDMTGEDLFELLEIESLGTMMEVHNDFLIDAENGKANNVASSSSGGREYSQTEYYRVKGEKIEKSYSYGGGSTYKDVYGPYKDAATAKGVLVKLSDMGENIAAMNVQTEDGKSLNVVKDFSKFTFSKGEYNVKLSMEMTSFGFDGKGSGTATVKLTGDYVSSVKFVLTQSVPLEDTLDEDDIPDGVTIPEGITVEVNMTAEAGLASVGSTVVSDEGIPEVSEDDTDEYAVITTEEQFKGLFTDLHDGIQFSYYDESTGVEIQYTVELRQTDNGYEAYVRDWADSVEHSYFYIADADGIKKYEGEYESGMFQGWGEATELSGGFDELVALLPELAKYYFAKYEGGKTLPELYEKFEYVDFDTLGAVLKCGDKTVKVKVEFSEYGDEFSINRLYFNGTRTYVYHYVHDLDRNRPDAE